MKLTFSHASLKALWNEAVQQWPISVQSIDGRSSRAFWLVGDEGIYLTHNGARPRGSDRAVAYASECNPLKMPRESWSAVKQAVFGGGNGSEFVEMVLVGTAVDAGCDIQVVFEHDTMTVAVVEGDRPSVQWQSLRTAPGSERASSEGSEHKRRS
jgi:Protein of unknown function (DUF3085)